MELKIYHQNQYKKEQKLRIIGTTERELIWYKHNVFKLENCTYFTPWYERFRDSYFGKRNNQNIMFFGEDISFENLIKCRGYR